MHVCSQPSCLTFIVFKGILKKTKQRNKKDFSPSLTERGFLFKFLKDFLELFLNTEIVVQPGLHLSQTKEKVLSTHMCM